MTLERVAKSCPNQARSVDFGSSKRVSARFDASLKPVTTGLVSFTERTTPERL